MRRFEMTEGGTKKFWEIDVDGETMTVRFGRMDTSGQTKAKKLPSGPAAIKEAEKLVREKVGKGYVEVGPHGKPASPKAEPLAPGAKTKPAKAPLGNASLSVPLPTGTFGWTDELDTLYERGFPFLRILTDDAVPPKTAIREAKKANQAIDPYLPVHIPRDVATRYLAGYPFHQYEDEASMLGAMNAPPPIDVTLLRRVLATKLAAGEPLVNGKYVGETYEFRIAEVLFLFEAFLGAETLLEEAVLHLAHARDNPKAWGSFVDHENNNVARMIAPLGWLRLRMPKKRFSELVAPLAGDQPRLPRFVARLRTLYDDSAPVTSYLDLADIGMQRRSRELLEKRTERFSYLDDPQFYFVMGKEALLKPDISKLKQDPKWRQLRAIDEFGTMRAPGAARLIAGLLESRSAGTAAAVWLDARRTWIQEEALPVLEKADPKSAATLRAHFGGTKITAPKKSKKELEGELRSVLASVGPALVAVNGNSKKERAILEAAFASYCEIRAALGDVSPDAYFTHTLGDLVPTWGVDRETSMRWMDVAVDVT